LRMARLLLKNRSYKKEQFMNPHFFRRQYRAGIFPDSCVILRSRILKLLWGLTGSIVMLQLPLHAQTADDWLGGTNNWSNPAFWDNGVPDGGNFDVRIDNGNAVVSVVTTDSS